MKLSVENDFQQKVMAQSFEAPVALAKPSDVQAWRSQWTGALGSWHSPYKVLVDCSQLSVGDDPEVVRQLELMLRFFNGFFLKKIVGYGRRDGQGHERLPFPVHPTAEEAAVDAGIRAPKERTSTDFRSTIQLQSHFQQHVIELNFAEPVVLASKEQVQILRSKLTNTLMQWHSKWSLIVDCTNLEVTPEAKAEMERMLVVLKGFFMKTAVGYQPRGAKDTYPFPVYRARHKAAAELEGEGNFSGDAADCKSRK